MAPEIVDHDSRLCCHSPGQVSPISPGWSALDTNSLSRLTCRKRSRRASLFRILSRPTASTSIAPPDEPRVTFSREAVPWGISTYFAERAERKETPYAMAGDWRMKEPLLGTLRYR